jgi:hypothetical protein
MGNWAVACLSECLFFRVQVVFSALVNLQFKFAASMTEDGSRDKAAICSLTRQKVVDSRRCLTEGAKVEVCP